MSLFPIISSYIKKLKSGFSVCGFQRSVLRLWLAVGAVAMSLPGWGQGRCEVVGASSESLTVSFSVPTKFVVGSSTVYGQRFNTVVIDGFDVSSEMGKPMLPTLHEWIEVPVCGRVGVEVVYEEHVVLDGDSLGVTLPIAPRQPSACKTASRNADTLVMDREVYGMDDFVGAGLVSVNVVGTARDRRLAQLVLSPVRYNPVSNQFLVYTRVEAVVRYFDVDETATKELAMRCSAAFDAGVVTVNSLQLTDNNGSHSRIMGMWASRPSATKQSGNQAIKYLIVSHPMFRGYLDDFVEWKRSVGYIVDTVYTDYPEVGTDAQSIKAYIKRQYIEATAENPAPTYLLLVGDVYQLPAFDYSYRMDYYDYVEHISDLNYACWTDDNIPDCYYGRLSAQSVGQLQTQLRKILLYERYEFPDPSFLDRAVLVAGVDSGYESDHGYTHADPAMDYAAKLYVNGNHGFLSVKEFKNNTSIDPHVANVRVYPNTNEYAEYIRSLYSAGAGWINYSAHGQWNRWDRPLMSNDYVSAMTNTKKCGVMIGNCCLTAKFDEPTCFAESLMRTGDYCGAAAYIGGSNSTYWNEDFYWAVGIRHYIGGGMQHEYNPAGRGAYDNIFHTHGEDFPQWATTMGALLMSGNMSVENSSSDIKDYYWQIYHLFGDPGMMPWLSQAREMPLSYSGADEGSTQVNVATAPYAYTAVTDADNNLVGAAIADRDGRATIACNAPIEQGNMKLSSIAQGYKPLIVTIDRSQLLAIGDQLPVASCQWAIRISPNPTTDVVNIETATATTATLFGATGRPVMTFSLAAGTNRIELSALPAGVYFLRTADGRSGKIVKQ